METGCVNLFQIWKVYQRRAESIAYYFDMRVAYYHYPWEEKSKVKKSVSYILKSLRTAKDLIKYQPKLVFIQLPPTPALYIVGLYAYITKTPYVADCHNAMFLEWWIRWPLAKQMLRSASAVLVHNNDVRAYAERYGVKAMVVRDPLPQGKSPVETGVVGRFGLTAGAYVIVPWNLATDEPIAEFIEAVKALPDTKFAMTWFTERLPESLRHGLPDNLVFTGYLGIDEFNELFASAGAAISLTTQKGTQPSAAAEAVAFGIPIILSDTETARLLYRDVPVFVKNNPHSISEGISEVFNNMSLYRQKVAEYKTILKQELEEEVEVLKTRLS
jgi:glycosyltransferase involved in cell wall biosynthesis